METVILLHGLNRTSSSMWSIGWMLKSKGYRVVNLSYPTRKLSVETLSLEYLTPAIIDAQATSSAVHFVSHSLGGIILRHYLEVNGGEGLGRAVMLAPPNGGSEIIDFLLHYPKPMGLLGPAAPQLSTSPDSFVNQLGDPAIDTGVIAGEWSWNPLLSSIIPGADDGKVSVARTELTGMKDHLVVSSSHTFIQNSSAVHKQILFFLGNGKFDKQEVSGTIE